MTTLATKAAARPGDDWQMPLIVQILYIVAPIQFFLIYVGDTQLTAGMMLGAVVGALGIILFVSSHVGLHLNEDRPIIYGLIFICLCTYGIATTTYGAPAVSKGLINLFTIISMLGMSLIVVRTVANYSGLFEHLVRMSAYVTGVIAALGVFQSFVSNILRAPWLFDLTEISRIAGTNWWAPAIENGIVRAQSIYEEPSFLAGYIGFTTGLAFLRVGLFGSKKRDALRETVPLWAAWSILLCMILTISPVCYSAMIMTAVGIAISCMRFRMGTVLVIALLMAVTLGACAAIVLAVGGSTMERFTSLIVFSQLSGTVDMALAVKGDLNLSTVILFLNAVVTLHNVTAHPFMGVGLGAHPFSYDAFLPHLSSFGRSVMNNGKIITYNRMDAASLFLRLMSETGILGTLAFTTMCVSAMLRARRTILEWLSARPETTGFTAMSIGLNGAMLGVFVSYMFRIPHYYSPPFWTLLALCMAIPQVKPTVPLKSALDSPPQTNP